MSTNPSLPTHFDPKTAEDRIYAQWEAVGAFRASAESNRKPFSIVMPPPNVTANLHVGHALDNTIQDVLIRRRRMGGWESLWQPGTDHAGIATQHVVTKHLHEQGKNRLDLGREAFVAEVWKWKESYEAEIIRQMKTLGLSPDWDRLRFTMDEGLSRAVREVFVRYYQKGLIYRGDYIINWCPSCRTALSDVEVEHRETAGHLYHVRYRVPVSGDDAETEIAIATTRPETILGDVGIAVHPDDERYGRLVGRTAIVPLAERPVPIFADEFVDREFGTGAVKITPAHDPNDYEIGLRAGLEALPVMDETGHMTPAAGARYAGMDRMECRRLVIDDLQAGGLMLRVEDHTHAVGECHRCSTVVEPLISRQWFVRMKPLADPAMEAVRSGRVRFVPDRFSKTFMNWMENIRDWCISRQLWWGHQIPAWYCVDCEATVVAVDAPAACDVCGGALVQDEDVLDTWFSSALWPFSTLGWPEDTAEMRYFFPTSVLVTGWDIIPFWVARMIFSALEFTQDIPFQDVLIHGLVLDAEGRKMSKSLGNGVDPLEVVDQYGADALRFSLLFGNSPGNDMRFYWEKVQSGRNFANKIWNACRFILMNLDDDFDAGTTVQLEPEDRWIMTRLDQVMIRVTQGMDEYQLGEALREIYEFAWNEFCDWYIEMSKIRLSEGTDAGSRQAAQHTLHHVLSAILKLLHPYMPFVTEAMWEALPGEEGLLITAAWPLAGEGPSDPDLLSQVELLQEVVRSIRNLRAEVNVPPSQGVSVVLAAGTQSRRSLDGWIHQLQNLAKVSDAQWLGAEEDSPEQALAGVARDIRIYVPLAGVIDVEKERDRLQKKLGDVQAALQRSQGKLRNPNFVDRAPEHVVQREKDRVDELRQEEENLAERIGQLG